MGTGSQFKIDLSRTFPHLANAPIVEAVIEIRARVEAVWEESEIVPRLKSKLPDYPDTHSINAVTQQFTFETAAAPKIGTHEMGWDGLRMRSADTHHVVQFTRDSFLFSRLQPYESWEHLENEAMRLWEIHSEVAKPREIQRLGVRFINRIPMPPKETRFEDYIEPHAQTPRELDLPFLNFLHKETFVVPGSVYGINITKTLQFPQNRLVEGVGILIDVDVFTVVPFILDENGLKGRLKEMRWLKNKSFFGSITAKALEVFR